MLTEVDEREPERSGVGPADRTSDGIHLREQVRGHQRGGEVQGRHGGERIPSEHIVKIVPAVTPEALAVLEHHAPHGQGGGGGVEAVAELADLHLAIEFLDVTVGRGPPGGRCGHCPVDDRAEVEDCVHPSGGGPEFLRLAQRDVCDREMRHREPRPMAPDEHGFEAIDLTVSRQPLLQSLCGDLSEAEHAVEHDRVLDVHALA